MQENGTCATSLLLDEVKNVSSLSSPLSPYFCPTLSQSLRFILEGSQGYGEVVEWLGQVSWGRGWGKVEDGCYSSSFPTSHPARNLKQNKD